MMRYLLFALLCLNVFVSTAAPDEAAASFSRPHLFVENRGQVHGADGKPAQQVLFHLAGNGLNVSLTARSIHYTFFKAVNTPAATAPNDTDPTIFETLGLDVSLEGASSAPRITAEGLQPYREHFYLPGCGASGLTDVRSYARVVYHDVYPNIDWVVYVPLESAGSMKYDFVVRPGGDPSRIRLKYSGPAALSLQNDGSISVKTELGSLQEEKPYSYVRESGTEVSSAYVLAGNEVRFKVSAPVDGTLVIDPRIAWATYFGGNNRDAGQNMGILEHQIYVCGETLSTTNLATFGAHKTTHAGNSDAFLAKFSKAGSLVSATYFGGQSLERCWAMAIDTAHHFVYIAGQTVSSAGIATSGAHQTVFNDGPPAVINAFDGFIAKFRPSGTLVWASYYGGGGYDAVTAADCDAQGNLYIAGAATYSASSNIATTGTHRSTHSYPVDSFDTYIAKFDTSGSRVWGTFYGGGNIDAIVDLCTDHSGNIIITGYTYSHNDIATSGAHQTAKSDTTAWANMDATLAKFNPSGNLIWSTYYGGNWDDFGQSVTCDSLGNIYLCGITHSWHGMSTPGAFQSAYGGGRNDAFLAKFSSAGKLGWSTYYGGDGYEAMYPGLAYVPYAFYYYHHPKWSVILNKDTLWLAGHSTSDSGMATANAFKSTLSRGLGTDSVDAIIASFDTAGKRIYGTYFGSFNRDYGSTICAEGGSVFVAGMTESAAGVASSGAFQTVMGGACDAFLLHLTDSVVRIRAGAATPQCAGATFSLNVMITGGTTMQPGNMFRVQLSNALGLFSAPVMIGSWTTVTGGPITCTLPAGISGTGYKLRIISTNPSLISDTVGITVNPLPQPVVTYTGGMLGTTVYSTYQWYYNGVPIPGATGSTYTPSANGQYTVSVTSGTGCGNISSPVSITGLGLRGTPPTAAVKVYPNPAQDVLNIEGAASRLHASLSNMLGQQVAEAVITAPKGELSLATIPSGVYLLRLAPDGGPVETVRIVKQ